MESKIPLPTDNIFKFYALFGLLLFIFGIGSVIYIVHTTNELVFQTMIDVELIKQMAKPSDADLVKKSVLEKRIQIAVSDRDFSNKALGAVIGIGWGLMVYGFMRWHFKVQPIQDEIVRLQLEKLRYEVKQIEQAQKDS